MIRRRPNYEGGFALGLIIGVGLIVLVLAITAFLA